MSRPRLALLGGLAALATFALQLLARSTGEAVALLGLLLGIALFVFAATWRAQRRQVEALVLGLRARRFEEVAARCDALLASPQTAIRREVLELMRAEADLWRGRFEEAGARLASVDAAAIAQPWRGAIHAVRLAARLEAGGAPLGREALEGSLRALERADVAALFESAVLLAEGRLAEARERLEVGVAGASGMPALPPHLQGWVALARARVAHASGQAEEAARWIGEAERLGEGTFIPEAARRLR